MKNGFFNEHKKGIIVGALIFAVLIFIFFIIFFVVPSFGGDRYGDRLSEIKSYKVSSSTISDIKNTLKESEGVKDVTYNIEGRILNFIITFEDNYNLDSAKTVSNVIIEKIGEKNLKYYDVQIFLDAKGDNFPMIGYHSKGSDTILWANAGDGNES